MSFDITAAKSGTFSIGGEIKVHRLGFGSMRLTGPGIWGPPPDRTEALRTLRRLPDLGVNFIDTLKRSPVMLPIPGTSKVAHLEENVAALAVELSNEEFSSLDREGKKPLRR